jgi:hypothetical protein
MALPPEIPTLEALATKNRTRVDNIFCDEATLELVDECTTREDWRPVKTDHFPIITRIRLLTERPSNQTPRRDYKMVLWTEFNDALEARLSQLPRPAPIENHREAYERLDQLNGTIAQTVEEHVPLINPCPYTKRWWNKNLTDMRKEVKRAARRARRVIGIEGHPDTEAHRRLRNKFAEAIRAAKSAHWIKWLEEINHRTIWNAHKLVKAESSDGGAARVPVLRMKDVRTGEITAEAMGNAAKADMFYEAFFPPKPAVSSVPEDFIYPDPRWKHEPISDEQIVKAITKLKPGKASKPGTIPNDILLHAGKLLAPHLGPIFRATDDIGWYPDEWKVTQTPVIKKPGKTDYATPGAWRPVVLSDGIARLLNKCKATDMMTRCEELGLLQENHFGGRQGRSTTDSVHLLVQTIKDAWRKGLIVSMLFLDVKGAFPSVAID